jgi:hypothetical protein
MPGAISHALELAYYSAPPNVCAMPSRVDKHNDGSHVISGK